MLSKLDSESQSEENSDDLTSEIASYTIEIQHTNYVINSDLEVKNTTPNASKLTGDLRTNFAIVL